MDYSPPVFSVHGILQERILEWVATPLSRGSSWPRNWSNPGLLHCRQILYHLSHQSERVKLLSHVWLFVTLGAVACQAPPSTGFSRQKYWKGLPFPSPGNLLDPWIKLGSPVLQQTLYHLSHQGSPQMKLTSFQITNTHTQSQENGCMFQIQVILTFCIKFIAN